jgi:hypothetical protein
MDSRYKLLFLSKKVLIVWLIIQLITFFVFLFLGKSIHEFFDFVFLTAFKVFIGIESTNFSIIYALISSFYAFINGQMIGFRLYEFVKKAFYD